MENTDKLLNWISVTAAAVGGFFAQVLGGWDVMLKSLLVLLVLDYITGIIKAIYNKELSSEIGFKGIIKKVLVLILVVMSCTMQTALHNSVPLREIVIVFFIVNEGLSLVENISEIIPVPEKLKEVLLQLRENTKIKNKKEDK